MFRKIIIISFLLITFKLYSYGYSIDEILTILEKNNFSIKQAEQINNSLKKQAEAEASDLMDMTFGYELMDLTNRNNNFDSDMIQHNFYLKQQFPISGKLYFKKKLSLYEYLASLEDLRMKKLELKKMALNVIIDWNLLDEIEKNRNNELSILNKILDTIKIQYTTSKASLSDVTNADIKITQTKSMLIEIAKMKESLTNEILDILDLTDDDFNVPKINLGTVKFNDVSVDSKYLYKKAIDFNPLLKINDYNINRFINMKKLAISQFVPEIMAMLEYTLKPNPVLENRFGIGVELNLPVFSSYSKAKKFEMYKSQQREFEIKKKGYENDLLNLIKRIIIEFDKDNQLTKITGDKILKLGENNIENLLQAYQVDKVNYNAVLDSIMLVYEEKNQYFEYLNRTYKTLFELESLTGEKLYSF